MVLDMMRFEEIQVSFPMDLGLVLYLVTQGKTQTDLAFNL